LPADPAGRVGGGRIGYPFGVRYRASRLLALGTLLLPAAVLAAELLPHGHAALEVDRVAHEVSVAVGDGPCRAAVHWDAAEPLHHPACAACAWVARASVPPLGLARVALPAGAVAARLGSAPGAPLERPVGAARGRAPPPQSLRSA